MLFRAFRPGRAPSFAATPPRQRSSWRSVFLQQLSAQRSTAALIICTLITALLAVAALNDRVNVAADAAAPQMLPLWWLLGLSGMLAVLLIAIRWLWLDFAKPLTQLKQWLLAMHAGYLSERLPEKVADSFVCINADLNTLANMLEAQSRHAERQLREHTEHITQKTRSLAALYRIAISINTLQNMREVFNTVLKTLEDIFNLDGAMIRLRSENGKMQKAAQTGSVAAAEAAEYIAEDSPFLQDESQSRRIVIPLKYHGSVLGLCCLYLDEETFSGRAELGELFTSVGYHLGIAVVKTRLDERSKRLSIIQDRAWIANELHDSLAQTISSLRFQARVLDQAVRSGSKTAALQELGRLESNIETANNEVRDLIEHFRDTTTVSLQTQNLVSIEQFVRQFRKNNPQIHVFLQKEWTVQSLPATYENEILRIVQEALTNVCKHSNADFVRLLLRDDGDHHRIMVIEDNGRGMTSAAAKAAKGKHFGMDMMLECATRINGRLNIETEPGEGTRIQLRFPYTPADSSPAI